MHRILLILLLTGCTGGVLMTGLVWSEEPPEAKRQDQEKKAARMEYMKQAAKSYEIALSAQASKKSALIEEPLLRFDDQVTGVLDGTLFMWTIDERPVATASVWIRKSGQEFHEFQSLTDVTLTATSQGQRKWTPSQPGIKRERAPIAQPPAGTAVRRLAQMRALAREYSATVKGWSDDQTVLRLLPQPVYRYGRPEGTVADGALFAFCKGTNPEVLLLVEAIKKDKELEWSQAFARMSSRGCEVCREDKVVWSAPLVRGESPTDPYYNVVSRYKGPGAGVDTAPDK